MLGSGGCGGKRSPRSRTQLKSQAREAIKTKAPPAIVRVQGGEFKAEDDQGRTVLVARMADADALVQPAAAAQGPVSLTRADLTLYKVGQPSLWLKAPVATWNNGLLTAPRGARSGSLDGKVTLVGRGKTTWTAKSDLLAVTTAECEVREPGRPALLAAGPTATWQNGLLVLPAGAVAHTTDRSASMRADRARWRSKTHSMEATGHVRMTRERLAGAGERLTGDTTLRQFRLTGGRPRVTFYEQPAPLVLAASPPVTRIQEMTSTHSWPIVCAAISTVLLAAVASSPAAASRQQISIPTGETIVADAISGRIGVAVHAIGRVVMTGTPGSPRTLEADRVDVNQSKPGSGTARSAVQEARATGHVRLTSRPKPDERMEATGAAGAYWPGNQKATLTGGVTVTMTSPQLLEPAVLTGSRAEIDLAHRAADVFRSDAAQVALRLHPKAQAPHSGSTAPSTGAAGPVRLEADRMRMDNAANRVTATGSPVLLGDQGTVRGQTIWFDIDPKANDVKTVHASGSVLIDSQDPQRGTFHAKSDEAVMNRDSNTVILTGNVHGTNTRPDEPRPETLQTDVLIYNYQTGEYSMNSAGEARSQVQFTPKPKPAASQEGATATPKPAGKPLRRRGGK
jgi:lipopolysaccharide transport protein LptA